MEMSELNGDRATSGVPEYSGNVYLAVKHGMVTTIYLNKTPEFRRMVKELNLGSAGGGLIEGFVPNGDLPPAAIIFGDKANELVSRLKAEGWKERNGAQASLDEKVEPTS